MQTAEPKKTSDEKKTSDDRWAAFKDRLGIVGVIVGLLLLGFMMVDGAIMNFQCSFTEFITFECNRWDASFKSWDEIKHR